MINADDVMPLLVAAVPSFAEKAPESDDDGTRLHYLDAGAFGRHLVDLLRGGADEELHRGFDVIEALHTEGDDYVRELATIGFLEGVQNTCSNSSDMAASDFEPYLGPESRRWWQGLNDFWAGRSPTVVAAEEGL